MHAIDRSETRSIRKPRTDGAFSNGKRGNAGKIRPRLRFPAAALLLRVISPSERSYRAFPFKRCLNVASRVTRVPPARTFSLHCYNSPAGIAKSGWFFLSRGIGFISRGYFISSCDIVPTIGMYGYRASFERTRIGFVRKRKKKTRNKR